MAKERIDKLISSQSMMTRSDVAKLVKNGKVRINGKTVKSVSEKAEPERDIIEVDSVKLVYEKNVYIMMNKPAGTVSASRDPKERTVVDILPENLLRPNLFPAGRLDKDTTGFVLITDDGDFAHYILSPKHHIDKTYLAQTDAEISDDFLSEIRDGMTLGEEKLLPAKITLVEKSESFVYEIILNEGKYHQIKRMISYCGVNLLSLKRTKMGNLPLDENLMPGESRKITSDELESILTFPY